MPPDQFHPERLRPRPAGQHQERPVPRPDGHAPSGRQGPGDRQRPHPGLRARGKLRLQQPGLRHALAGDHARHRLPGGFRRHPLRANAGRIGRCLRRHARDGAGARPGGGGGRRGRTFHGVPSATGRGAVGRPELLADRKDGGAIGRTGGAGSGGQVARPSGACRGHSRGRPRGRPRNERHRGGFGTGDSRFAGQPDGGGGRSPRKRGDGAGVRSVRRVDWFRGGRGAARPANPRAFGARAC